MPDEFAVVPVPGCNSEPGTRPTFDASPFQAPNTPEPPPSDPGDFLPFKVTISPLPATMPGALLVYTVTLTNVSDYDKPINLAGACPSYVQRLFLPGETTSVETRLALNCGPAGVLTRGASATFEMRLGIPADAAPGTATIVWQLGERGEGAKPQFQIVEGPTTGS
jgi:hypothetical protein